MPWYRWTAPVWPFVCLFVYVCMLCAFLICVFSFHLATNKKYKKITKLREKRRWIAAVACTTSSMPEYVAGLLFVFSTMLAGVIWLIGKHKSAFVLSCWASLFVDRQKREWGQAKQENLKRWSGVVCRMAAGGRECEWKGGSSSRNESSWKEGVLVCEKRSSTELVQW